MAMESINLWLLGIWILFVVAFYYVLLCNTDTCSPSSYIGDILLVAYSACITYFLLENLCILMFYKVLIIAVLSHFTGRIFFILIRHYKQRNNNGN